MRRVLLVLVAAVVAVAFSGVARAQDVKAKGEKLFTDQKCSMCHSIAGKGNKKLPLDDVGSKLKAEEIREWIVSPKTAAAKHKAPATMKSYEKLPKEDVDALVAYLETLKK